MLDSLLKDIRYGVRNLARTPGLYRRCGTHTGAGDWSEHGDFQRGRRCSASAPSLSPPREFGRDLDRTIFIVQFLVEGQIPGAAEHP
jgi:hypothetical protein